MFTSSPEQFLVMVATRQFNLLSKWLHFPEPIVGSSFNMTEWTLMSQTAVFPTSWLSTPTLPSKCAHKHFCPHKVLSKHNVHVRLDPGFSFSDKCHVFNEFLSAAWNCQLLCSDSYSMIWSVWLYFLSSASSADAPQRDGSSWRRRDDKVDNFSILLDKAVNLIKWSSKKRYKVKV